MTRTAAASLKPAVAQAVAPQPSPAERHELDGLPAVERLQDMKRMLNGRPTLAAQLARADRLADGADGRPAPRPVNRTGLPDELKAGVEALSGLSMDSVRVHRNSARPAAIQAHAFAQGTDIHLAPGQDRHLPHEAWHVVQQAQGRVKPGQRMTKGVGINDDAGLEREADAMGAAALRATPAGGARRLDDLPPADDATAQRKIEFAGKAAGFTFDQLKAHFTGDEPAEALLVKWEQLKWVHTITDVEVAVAQIETVVEVVQRWNDDKREYLRHKAAHDLKQVKGERSAAATLWLSTAAQKVALLENRVNALWFDDPERILSVDGALGELEAAIRSLGETTDWAIPVPDDDVAQIPTIAAEWDDEELRHLRGQKAALKSGKKPIADDAIAKIRGKDDTLDEGRERVSEPRFGEKTEWPGALKGAILYDYIKNSRAAILDLVAQLGDNVALFSLERGGSLLADLIADFQAKQPHSPPLINVKVPKVAGRPRKATEPKGNKGKGAKKEEEYLRAAHHMALVAKMMDTEEGQVFKILNSKGVMFDEPPVVKIALAETAVSGASVNTLLGTLNKYHDLLPNSQFTVLAERQTLHLETDEEADQRGTIPIDERGGMRVADPGIDKKLSTDLIEKVRLFISHVEYILGEDVGYQVSYSGAMRGQPLLVFDEREGQIVAAKFWAEGARPRDVLRLLIGGALDDALRQIFAH